MNILEKIINDKKKEVKLDKIKNPIDQLKKKVSNKKYIFSNTLENYKQENKIAIIAEIKKASPSKGIIKENFDHLKIAEEYIKNNAACLSVLTEKKYFLGNKKFVRDIKKKFNTPVLNKDFFIGYSPERINPGDKIKKLTNIKKVTSGSTEQTAKFVDDLYLSIIKAGTFKATSIKVAEASKIIENVQRDVNIALVNEFYQIFQAIGISTKEVVEAASTKWNFMSLMPGLVGGHCIGVDPYYLLQKSESKGFIPDLMRTAREINDSMPNILVSDFLMKLVELKI